MLMKLSATPPAVRTTLASLIDYAGLFPPAQRSMPDAVAEYVALRGEPEAWMLGRFVVPAASLDALLAALDETAATQPVAISLIAGAGSDAADFLDALGAAFQRVPALPDALNVESLEVPLPALRAARDSYDAAIGQLSALRAKHSLRDLPAFVELPRDERYASELSGAATALARAGLGAKLRCGGVVTTAFPTAEEVASFIETMADARVPFKCTAGLHHPVRHVDAETGFHMHGFLNIVTASIFAGALTRDELVEIVAEEDATAFSVTDAGLRWRDRTAGLTDIENARASRFISYGSCSFTEPVADLKAMGVLA